MRAVDPRAPRLHRRSVEDGPRDAERVELVQLVEGVARAFGEWREAHVDRFGSANLGGVIPQDLHATRELVEARQLGRTNSRRETTGIRERNPSLPALRG